MDNDISRVINRTALIENLLNQVILDFVDPDAQEFFWDVLLDSSIMSFGSKVKVVNAISQQLSVKLDRDSLHKVMTYRNAFAHHATDAHMTLFVGKTPKEDELHGMLRIIISSGKTESKRRDQALSEFDNCYEAAKASLVRLRNSIKANE